MTPLPEAAARPPIDWAVQNKSTGVMLRPAP